jgi:RNase P subunit RPR2
LRNILSFYSVGCSDCKHYPLTLRVDYQKNNVIIACPSCLAEWQFEQKLPEESGPQIASFLSVFQNVGRWQVDFSLMETIRKPSYRKVSPADTNAQKKIHKKRFEQKQHLFCPKCGKLLREKNSRYGRFWGCSGYPECTYTKHIK